MSILALTSDTLIVTPAAGNIEYSSPIFAATPIGTQRGIVPTQQYYRLNSAYVGTNGTSAQSIFGVGVTLSASTVYEFEINLVFNKTAGTTSHTFGFGFAGTASLNNILYLSNGVAIASSTSGGGIGSTSYGSFATTASNSTTNMQTTNAAVSWAVILKGTVSINAGGTFIPQYTLTAAPGGAYSTVAGSFIRIAPVSASGSNTSVGAWA
jgi:hypothetical protein